MASSGKGGSTPIVSTATSAAVSPGENILPTTRSSENKHSENSKPRSPKTMEAEARPKSPSNIGQAVVSTMSSQRPGSPEGERTWVSIRILSLI